MKKALITGITGQDGAYLAELLLSKGYEVHGIKRRASLFNTDRIDHLYQDPHVERRNLLLHYGDLTDSSAPHPRDPDTCSPTRSTTSARRATWRSASRCRSTPPTPTRWGRCASSRPSACSGWRRKTRFYQASSSELYGLVQEVPQKETTPFYPRSPYARGQALRLLDHGELPRGLRHVRLQRHPVQPRIAGARRDLRDAQDHARAGAHQARAAGLPLPRQPRRAARLGPCARLRRDAVADAAAGTGRGLRHRHRRAAQRARVRGPCRRRARAAHHLVGQRRRGDRRRPARPRDRARSTRAISAPPRSTRCSATPPRRARSSAGRRAPASASWWPR